MTQESDQPAYPEIAYVVHETPRKSILRRPGCILGLLLWLVILLFPFLLFILAVQGQITINHGGDVPDKHEHPRFQVKVISEIDFRGLAITTTQIDREDESLCIETDVRYVLWEGDGDPATYCDCYTREDPGSAWAFEQSQNGACS